RSRCLVHLVNEMLEMLVDDAALHLERRRELAALDREVTRQNREAIDEHLVRLAHIPLVNGGLEERENPRLLHEVLHRQAAEAVLLRPARELLEVRHEEACEELPPGADENRERDERMSLEDPLD